ncbi:spore coat protein [Oceanobacillus piezotolerans]|uniref:Spore coat protein n=1 Tax=Oceanobacillus piezotolerans TaxID=2448030 RepID=A0A498DC84_9BACI|nr:spore coat protein [Oceanobacillus piezotolerans]RLL46577.1 spore coat protein [Oceanobacillus piezotolerans]
MDYPNHLAWHETLDLHELVAFQSIALMKLKKFYPEVKDAELQSIYQHTINGIEMNLQELLQFYSFAPRDEDEEDLRNLDTGFFSGDLLAFAKTAVRNYSIAITETATPVLRDTLNKQLQRAIETHGMVYAFMYKKGYYPSYDLEKLLQNDIKLANKALKMNY